MTARRLDLTMEQGADFTARLPITDQFGQPIELVAAALQVRTASGDPAALLSLDTDGNGLTIDAAAGDVLTSVAGAVVAAVLPGKYVYDLFGQYQTGGVFRLYTGFVFVCPRVTVFTFGPSPAPSPSPSPSPSAGGVYDFSDSTNSAYAALI